MFEQEEWKGGLVQSMKSAGVDIQNIPPQLAPSVHPLQDDFLTYETDPLDYSEVHDLLTTTFVLCPALSRFKPGYLSGESLGIGYQAAIAIDGAVLLGLLQEDEIMVDRDNPERTRVFGGSIHRAVKKLLE